LDQFRTEVSDEHVDGMREGMRLVQRGKYGC